MSNKTEEEWIEDCHESPMYAADYIMKLQAENANLKTLIRAATKNATKVTQSWLLGGTTHYEIDEADFLPLARAVEVGDDEG